VKCFCSDTFVLSFITQNYISAGLSVASGNK